MVNLRNYFNTQFFSYFVHIGCVSIQQNKFDIRLIVNLKDFLLVKYSSMNKKMIKNIISIVSIVDLENKVSYILDENDFINYNYVVSCFQIDITRDRPLCFFPILVKL